MKQSKSLKLYMTLYIITVFLFCGCSDFLDRDHPTGVTDNDFWKTMNECEAAMGECKSWPYALIDDAKAPSLGLVSMEGMTDNMYFMSNYHQQIVNFGNGSITPTSGGFVSGVWSDYYKLIRKCNRFLYFADNAYFTDEKERTRMKAEIYVWRAWYHMQLLLYYGMQDGIPIVNEPLLPADIYKPRNTVEECLEFINADLDKMLSTPDDIVPFVWDEGLRSRMSKSSALVLKMDLNLQFKKYNVAKETAKQIIDKGVFELYKSDATDNSPGKNFRDLFRYKGQQNKERILFTKGGLHGFFFRCMGAALGGQGTAAVLKSLVDEFETIDGKSIQSLPANEKMEYEKKPLYKDRDPRLSVTVMFPEDSISLVNYTYRPFDPESGDYIGKTGASRSGYMLKKFMDEKDRASRFGTLDNFLYRYAEVLLDYVECLVETGDWQNPDVEKYINMIRNRAGMPNMDKNIYNTQEKVRELYRRERRVELAYEGKRYYDIRRWNIGQQTMNGVIEGAWNPMTNAFVLIENRACLFPKNDSWPLPQKEVTANPNISQPIGW